MALNSLDMMPKKEYLVGVTIVEGREIYGKDSGGTSDPFVKIKCADQVQQSSKKYEQNSAVWNQSLTFTGLSMNDFELETFELIIELYDHNAVFQNELIGVYSIGLSTLHRALNHEFYRQWVGVFNPDDPNQVQGYLMISCFIVGPGERPPVHGPDEEEGNDDGAVSDEDEEEFLKRMENLVRAKGVTVVGSPDVINKNYQLNVAVSKAEDIYVQDNEVVNPFISCRVNGCSQITKRVTKNRSPQFLSKLCFPITYPFLNDKITMRLWSWEAGLTPNKLVATIPEHPSAVDYFNISKLQTVDSRISSRWFNLYGPRPHERGPRTKGLRDGSAYLGRVLLSFSIIPCEKPALCAQNMQGSTKEPKQADFQLLVDLYDLIQFEPATSPDHNLWLQISQGEKKSEFYRGRFKAKNKTWAFAGKRAHLPTQFPEDYNQIADIFVDVYCNKGQEPKDRVGFIRLKAQSVARKEPAPRWVRLRSPYNDVNPATLGQLMLNVQFLRYDPTTDQPERQVPDRGKKQSYIFFYQILSGIELADAFATEKLTTRVEISIGNAVGDKAIKTKDAEGRYPQWMEIEHKEVFLHKEVAFQTDMKVSVQKAPTDKRAGYSVLGDFCVVIESLLKRRSQPQFFNVLTPDGKLAGQILANFYIKHFEKKNDQRQNAEEDEKDKIMKAFEEVRRPRPAESGNQFTVDFSLLGIRNMTTKMQSPQVTLWLSNKPHDKKAFVVEKREEDNKKDEGFAAKSAGYLSSLGFGQPAHEPKEELELQAGCYSSSTEPGKPYIPTENPTFGRKISFRNVELKNEPLLWPLLVIEIKDRAEPRLFEFAKKSQNMFTTIPLFKYAEKWMMQDKEFRYAEAQFSRNQTHLSYVQEQVDPKEFMKREGLLDEHEERQAENDDEEGDAPQGTAQAARAKKGRKRGAHRPTEGIFDANQRGSKDQNPMRGTMMRTTANNGLEVLKVTDVNVNTLADVYTLVQRQTRRPQVVDLHAVFKNERKDVERLANQEDKMFQVARDTRGGQFDGGADLAFGDDADSGDDAALDLGGAEVLAAANDYEHFGIVVGEPDEILVSKADKNEEKKQRRQRVEEIKQELVTYQRAINSLKDPQSMTNAEMDKKRIRQMHMLELTEEMNDLEGEEMTRERFWGAVADLDEVTFEYGRDIKKEENYDDIIKKELLPYRVFHLFEQDTDKAYPGKEYSPYNVEGFMRSGRLSGAFLKADVLLFDAEDEESASDDDDSEDDDENEEVDPNDIHLRAQGSQSEKPKEKQQENLEHHERVLLRQKAIAKDHFFEFFDDRFIAKLVETYECSFKVRVYLLSGQNLSAMSSSIDLKSRLAGMSAMCTANPFAQLTVGDGQSQKDDDRAKHLKKIGTKADAIEGDLNPEFLRLYELDARLPEDWKLKIEIKDKQAMSEQLIGATEIDLENRRHSDLLFLNREAVQLDLAQLEEKRKRHNARRAKQCRGRRADDPERKRFEAKDQRLKGRKQTLTELLKELKGVEQVYAPIEFRELYHPQKNQAQGILEMFVETFTEEDSRKIDPAKMKPVSKQTYEIRLVIWEAREIPLIDNGQVDITVRVTYDPTGNPSDEVVKNTDVHMNSKDGVGQFNWRMKFKLQTPCQFPRLKFQVFDSNVTGDVALGEASISVKRTMKTLMKEDKVNMPKSFIQLVSPQFKDDHRGILMFSMDILLMDDATQDPVGEAQDEPNKDPFLKTPTAGRGLGDAMASVGLLPSLDVSWNPFGKLLYVIIFFGVMGTILTFAVLLK